MTEIVIVDAARTPHGNHLGGLADVSAVELGATAIRGLIDRVAVEETAVDWTVMGNATSAGIGQVPARQAAVTAGIPENSPATTVNEASGSGLRAILLGVDRISSGAADIVVTGGMESMSNAPYLNMEMRRGRKWGDTKLVDSMVRDSLWDMLYDAHMGELTEAFNTRFDITREEQDAYALRSHERAVATRQSGLFEDEIVPVQTDDAVLEQDEGPRPDTSMEKLADLDPVFADEGSITAGNASDLSDGAAAAILAKNPVAEEHGLDVAGRVVDYTVSYRDPKWFPLAIEDAVSQLLADNDLTVDDVDAFELNEAFASHMVHFQDELGIPDESLNVRGGAIALGHPIGASGGILTTTLVHTMQQENHEYGVVGMCVGGGGGICMLVRR